MWMQTSCKMLNLSTDNVQWSQISEEFNQPTENVTNTDGLGMLLVFVKQQSIGCQHNVQLLPASVNWHKHHIHHSCWQYVYINRNSQKLLLIKSTELTEKSKVLHESQRACCLLFPLTVYTVRLRMQSQIRMQSQCIIFYWQAFIVPTLIGTLCLSKPDGQA